MFFIQLFVFILTTYSVYMAKIKYRDCGKGEIQSITLEPCPTQPCHFDQGARANLTITFIPGELAYGVHVKSTLRRGGLFDYEIDVPELDPNVCRNGNHVTDWGKIECPLQKGQLYTFVISRVFPMSTSYNIFRYSKLRILTNEGRLIACADMRLQFVRYVALNGKSEESNQITFSD